MPFTPFHLGPALAAKAVAPRHFSFLIFGFTQVIIDSEAAFYVFTGDGPIHRLLHTYLGATLVAALTVALGLPLLKRVIRLWNRLVAPNGKSILRIEPRIPLVAAVSGALGGGYSHVLMDSIMHSDLKPFAPWSESNALLQLVSADRLILICVVLGALGGAALVVASLRGRRARSASD